jgi:DNA-binding transcriptional LysR family regulator
MIRELKTFLAVVRFGTFAAAGVQVGLTQSAVSAQIHRLEEELGFALFDRTGRSATLNATGQQTALVAEELMAVYARLAQQGGTEEKTGLLRVGAIASAQASFLVDAIAQLRGDLPGWQVRVIPGVSLNLLAQVDSNELDLAVIIKPPFALPAEMQWTPLLAERFMLLVRREHANRSWRDLLQFEPFIRYDRSSFGGRLVDRFLRRERLRLVEVAELDELQGIVGLVERGVGVALIPDSGSLRIPDALTMLDVDDESLVREIGIARRDRRDEPEAVAHFARCIASAASPNRF